MIDWQSEDSDLLINTRLENSVRKKLKQAFEDHKQPGHIYLLSSGTESRQAGFYKLVAISKKAVLAAAQSVNSFFEITQEDKWLNPLPLFHIGGLSILARAHLSGSKVFSAGPKWAPAKFFKTLNEEQINFTSLVPTQIFDIISNQVKAPSSLKAVFVGGGRLHEDLVEKAKDLGWPLVLSYGMTESSAMLAVSKGSDYSWLNLLPHMQIKQEAMKTWIKSASLFNHYLMVSDDQIEIIDPKESDWFALDDKILMRDQRLRILGRETELIKVLGETVALSDLQSKAEALNHELKLVDDLAILALPDERAEHRLVMAHQGGSPDRILESFNEQVMPFEKLSQAYEINIDRSELGKIRTGEIREKLLARLHN